jgi:putative PIN family toxin of toxin-antitoxin system
VAVRAVLDTQVLVRGLLGIRRSACARLFDALADGVFVAVVSPHILQELRLVFELPRVRGRYHLSDEQVNELVDSYRGQAEHVSGGLVLPPDFAAVPAEDVPIVAAALEGDSEYLVSDDGDLLDAKTVLVAGYRPLQIVAPGPFVRQILGLDQRT